MIGPEFEKLSHDPEFANLVFLKVDVDKVEVSVGLRCHTATSPVCCSCGVWFIHPDGNWHSSSWQVNILAIAKHAGQQASRVAGYVSL